MGTRSRLAHCGHAFHGMYQLITPTSPPARPTRSTPVGCSPGASGRARLARLITPLTKKRTAAIRPTSCRDSKKAACSWPMDDSASRPDSVSYTHLRAHETRHDIVCRLLLEK